MGGQQAPAKSGGSFWTTLPGLITAFAALVTAVGGLLIAAGIIGSPKPGPTTGPISSVVTPSPAETVTSSPTSSPTDPVDSPSAPPGPARLEIDDLRVDTDDAYPVLDLLVANRGDRQADILRVVFVVDGEAVCSNLQGYALPQVAYDLRLPGVNGTFSAELPDRIPVEAGEEDVRLRLSVGRERSRSDQCRFTSSVALRYTDGLGNRPDSDPWPDPVTLTVHPLEKTKPLISLPVLPSQPVVKQP